MAASAPRGSAALRGMKFMRRAETAAAQRDVSKEEPNESVDKKEKVAEPPRSAGKPRRESTGVGSSKVLQPVTTQECPRFFGRRSYGGFNPAMEEAYKAFLTVEKGERKRKAPPE